MDAADTADTADVSGARADTLRAWFFVLVWGSGYLATKAGIREAPPFTFLVLRYVLGLACLAALLPWRRPTWPRGPGAAQQWAHAAIAGLLMHGVNLSGSHYAQYLGMSAGITAVLLATQPLLTAVVAHRWLGQPMRAGQWLGVGLGLAGVALVVWHKIDVRAVGVGSLVAIAISLAAITAGTLYQRILCAEVDLVFASLLSFALSALLLAPLAIGVEGFRVHWSATLVASVAFLVVMASILATNTLHLLMRRGHAAKVTSLMFLTPLVAVALEWLLYGIAPTALAWAGIAVICAGVALVTRA